MMTLTLMDPAFLGSLRPVVNGFTNLTFGGPFYATGWTIGTAGANPYGVAIDSSGANEPIHTASGSIM